MGIATVQYAAAAAAILLAAPGLARAEPFHMAHSVFKLTEAHADLVSDTQTRTEPDGARSILVTEVMLAVEGAGSGRPSIAHALHEMRLAFDCQAGTYKVLSETFYAGLDGAAPSPSQITGAAQPVADDDMRDFQQFACTGPRSLKKPMFGFQQQNRQEAVARVADDLERTLAKLTGAGL